MAVADHSFLTGDSGNLLKRMPSETVNCVVTSPPYYGLRDYGVRGQAGLEKTPEEYVSNLVLLFREVRRVLSKNGTLWLNIGDSYNANGRVGHGTKVGAKQGTNRASANGSDHTRANAPGLKSKDLIGIPWMLAFALRSDGWFLRQDIIWSKPNPMTESVQDRCTKSHEYIFLLSRSANYYFDYRALREPAVGQNHHDQTGGRYNPPGQVGHTGTRKAEMVDGKRRKRSVWAVPTQPYKGAHFATFPVKLVMPCIEAGCPPDGLVMDPFCGSGTVAEAAERLGRRSLSLDLDPKSKMLGLERVRSALLRPPAASGSPA